MWSSRTVTTLAFSVDTHPFNTVCLPLSYSGNPGVTDEYYRGANWKRHGSGAQLSVLCVGSSPPSCAMPPATALAQGHLQLNGCPSRVLLQVNEPLLEQAVDQTDISQYCFPVHF